MIIHKAASNLEEAKEAEWRSEKGNKYALTVKDKHVKDINGNIETPEEADISYSLFDFSSFFTS